MTRQDMERDMYFERMRTNQMQTLTQMEGERQTEQRQRAVEVDRFRQQQQKQKERDRMIQDQVADAYKYDETTFLRFRGEDPLSHERNRAQKQQQLDWLTEQINDLSAKQYRERADEAAYAAQTAQLTALRKQMEEEAESQRRTTALQDVHRNQHLAMEKRATLERDRRNDEYLSQQEVDGALGSNFMNETRSDVQRETFKGFTSAQRDAILEEQSRQVAALRQRKAAEANREAKAHNDAEKVRRAMVIAERQKMNQRTVAKHELRREHERQHKQKEIQYDYLDNVVYTNPPKEEFFAQFGQSAR